MTLTGSLALSPPQKLRLWAGEDDIKQPYKEGVQRATVRRWRRMTREE